MGRLPSVDGTPTGTITLRLPTWLLAAGEVDAQLDGLKSSGELFRNILITHFLAGREVKP